MVGPTGGRTNATPPPEGGKRPGPLGQMCATAGRSLLSCEDSITVEVRSMYRLIGYDPVMSIYGA